MCLAGVRVETSALRPQLPLYAAQEHIGNGQEGAAGLQLLPKLVLQLAISRRKRLLRQGRVAVGPLLSAAPRE